MIYYAQEQLEQAIDWVEKCIELEEAVQHPHLKTARQTLEKWRAELAQRS